MLVAAPGLLADLADGDPRRGRHRRRPVARRRRLDGPPVADRLVRVLAGRSRASSGSRSSASSRASSSPSALSLVAFIRRAWWPHDAVLGRADGVKGYHDLTYYPEARQVPGLLLYRFDAPLFFANADVFRDRVRERIDAAEAPVRWVIVAAEPITDVDTTAAAVLDALEAELADRGITLAFAELKDPVRERLRRYGALDAGARRAHLPDRRDGGQRAT